MDDAAIRREATELTADLIRIDTGNPPATRRRRRTCCGPTWRRRGSSARWPPDGRPPDLVARIPGTGDGPSLALCGHTDVVPADEPGWTHPPFAGHVDAEAGCGAAARST